jgi:predicted methyltransferase
MKIKNVGIINTVLLIIMCSFAASASSDSLYDNAVNHPDRTRADLASDAKRKPLDILPFTQIKAGDKVLELGAGGGYTTELLSWVVGDSGKIYAHFLYNKVRLKDKRLANVMPLREHSLNEHAKVLIENQINSEQLDSIVIFFVLHDIYLNNEMSDELLITLFKALKPGGSLIILDNAAKADSGLTNIGDLHRIGEKFVKSEIEKIGFVFDGSSDVLRNKEDDHTKPWGDFKGIQDRFAYRFIKPSN